MVTQANKPTGLLSKVIGFVRGKDDASPGESTLSPDSRQELRDLVARKRRTIKTDLLLMANLKFHAWLLMPL